MDSSKRGPPKKGFPSRGRAKRLGGHVNNLRESPSNAKHPQSKGRFVSQVNGRGKSPSGIRNQVCGRGALRKRFLPSLCLPTDASLEKNKENKLLPSDLISFLKLQSDEVVVQLLQHYSLVEDLVQSNTNDVMFTLMSVLAHAVNAQFLKEKLYELLNKIFQIRFVNKLCAFTITIKKLYPERAEQFFDNLVLVLEVYCHAMIYSATEKFPSLIDACISVIIALKPGSNCLERYENLQCMVSEALLTFKNVKCEKPNLSNVDKHISLTDFCLMSVYPTNEDLGGYYYPFLQRNITKGKYESNAHYLDVQFKLLREDFMRPLRDGVTACKIDSQSRNMDVYVYRNAKILKPEILKRELIHYVQLELPRMFNVATSKRFMFGNLLCFSCNNFESVIIATVFDVNPDKLTQGILAVKFESNVNLDYSQEYIVLESRAFFVAYKHVLTALKNMSGKELPFAPYIVYVQSDVNHPQYLTDEDKYDLRVLRDNELMNTSDTMLRKTNLNIEIQRFPKLYRGRSSLFAKESYVMPPDYKWSHLQAIEVMQDLELWPSESELGMDNSQRKALRNALTRELVIIQGPPGTGKTFIGLKIAQILLHNHLYPPGPILVVCFTNHALDQFLEGVLSFTRNIVRVGSRSNNEKIQEFQINKLARFRKYQRNIPFLQKLNNLQFEVDELEYMIRSLKVSIKECIERKGILKLQELIAYGIIPHHLQIQLQYYCHGLSGWLLTEQDYSFIYQDYEENEKSIESDEEFFDAVTEVSEHASEEKEIFKDVQELYNFEEQSRKIETYNDIHEGQIQGQSFLSYELTKLELSNKIKVLEKVIADNPEDIFSVVNYYIMKNNLLKLQRGLAVENVPKEIAAIGNMNVNLYELDSLTRWQLYRLWLNILVQILKGRLSQAENEFKLKSQVLKKVMDQEYLHVMKESSVVGMTTTGAAQYHNVMQQLAPPVVIIEEAAEVLEAHVITSLSVNCKHLIMIGDHQQLRPSTTVYELATKYGLDVSLFERMLNNGIPYDTLEYQHRMRPSISRLLVPSIYPELKDHPSVHNFPHINGVSSDVFFVTHEIPEDKGYSENSSHKHTHEAKFIMGLCQHLLRQGYAPQDVTILTPYTGQFLLLRKLQRDKTSCQGVRISVVDNFQGEENKIILLTLVRSNDEGKIGFLRIDNRVCVALSRAKYGFYIIGNMNQLCASSNLWKQVKADLVKEDSLSHALTLKCKNHPHNVIKVSSQEDFAEKSPEGGCWEDCLAVLPNCEHRCPRRCHSDDADHTLHKCNLKCSRVCERNHGCHLRCWEKCLHCTVIVTMLLPCSHSHKLKCHISPLTYVCDSRVEKEKPGCGHKIIIPCHKDPKSAQCTVNCNTKLTCGHECRLICHINNDPNHVRYKCNYECEKTLVCGHPCPKMCSNQCGGCDKQCEKTLPCNHPCPQKCSDTCGGCNQACEKMLLCGHPCPRNCTEECGGCKKKCEKLLPCGHQCPLKCSEKCGKCDNKCEKNLTCGHPCSLKCFEECGKCNEKCEKILTCGHPCQLKCSEKCGRCDEKCERILTCGHPCQLKCSERCGRCNEKCERILACGHPCQLKCSEKCGRCDEKCERILTCDHPCQLKCSEKCGRCDEKCERILTCGHPCQLKCSDECGRCDKTCKKILPCGHPCPQTCAKDCGGCLQLTNKTVPGCGHQVLVKCSENATPKSCKGKCPLLLKCGHPCAERCCDPCTVKCCQEVQYSTCPWKHIITKLCHISNKSSEEVSWNFCKERCDKVLPCGHKCRGSCGLCLQGRLHLPCTKRCERKLVCGHRCQELCATQCPPCRKTYKQCPHQPFNKCGARLVPCRKMCPWTCKHHQCSSKCSDKCSIPLCEESCTELLKCGHVCSGFCGDPCPQLCLVCDAEKLPPQLDNARYVLLEECGHAIEVRTLDAWMMKPCQEVGLKTCPECTLPVHYCRRYSDIIRNTHLELSVVLKMYMERRPQISAPYVMNSLRDFMSVEYFSKELYTLMVTMKMVPKQKSKKQNSGQKTPQNTQALSYNELRLIHFKANVLRKACMIKAYINKSRHKMSFHLQSSRVWHLVFQLDTLVKHVMNLTCYEASEVIEGVNSELQRLLLLPSFWYFDKEYKAKKSDHMKDVHEKLCVIFDPKNKFKIEQEHEVLSLLKQCNLAGNLIIYDQRRITSAMGVKITQGVWFKCSKGHIINNEYQKNKCCICESRS